MTGLSLLLVALLNPGNCPPEVGQIRWDGLSLTLSTKSGKVTIRGSVWDRDRNGKPSAKDVMRIDDAGAYAVDEVWFELRGSLADELARRFKRQPGLTSNCVSDFKVEGVPRIGSAAALSRHLEKLSGAGGPTRPEDILRADMSGWAEEICKQPKHTAEDALANLLASRAKGGRSKAGPGLIKRVAHQVASDHAVECAHFRVRQGITYD